MSQDRDGASLGRDTWVVVGEAPPVQSAAEGGAAVVVTVGAVRGSQAHISMLAQCQEGHIVVCKV